MRRLRLVAAAEAQKMHHLLEHISDLQITLTQHQLECKKYDEGMIQYNITPTYFTNIS